MGSHKEIYIDKEIQIGVINNSVSNGNFQSMQFQCLHLLLELNSKSSSGSSKELVLQITDESNPLVLLSVVISEAVYFNIKTTQGLLVDFHSFPHHLLDLIRKCIEEQEKQSPKFVLVLRTSSCELPSTPDVSVGKVTFEVIELNAFKHLCHLSLNLTPASLQTKLEHLSSCIKQLKTSLHSEKEKRVQENQFLTQNVEELRRSLAAKEKEMVATKEEARRKIKGEVDRCNNLVRQEKDLNLKWRSDFDRKVAREKRDVESEFNERLNEYQSKNVDLVRRNAELAPKNKTLDEALRKAKTELWECREELKKQTKHLKNIDQERAEWERELQTKRDKMKKLEMHLDQQRQKIEERDEHLQRNSCQLKAMTDQKCALETELNETRGKLEKRQESLQRLWPEFEKSLHVIQTVTNKLNKEEAMNVSLSKSLDEKEEELKKLKDTYEGDLKKRTEAETELESLKSQLKESTDKILQQENTLRNNENVISRLHKQLSDMESLEAVMKRAPLTEAYIHPQGRIETTSPSGGLPLTRTTSTPASNNWLMPPNFNGDSVQSKIYAPNAEAALNDIPKIPKEICFNTQENKENSPGLDKKYLEPTNPLPVHGILRANAVGGQNPTLKKQGQAPVKGQKGKLPKQSAYFSKKS